MIIVCHTNLTFSHFLTVIRIRTRFIMFVIIAAVEIFNCIGARARHAATVFKTAGQ